MGKKTIQQLSIDSRTLYDRLVKVEVGAEIRYPELSDLIGRDVQSEARGNLMTARNMARREKGMVFGVITNVGLKRLADEEIVGVGMRAVTSIGKASRRAMQKLVCVQNFDKMKPETQVKHNTMLSVLGVMSVMSKPKKIVQIEDRVAKTQKRLPIADTIEAFAARKKAV
jgi:hypothetical protein